MSTLSAIASLCLFLLFPVFLSLGKTGIPGISNFSAASFLSALGSLSRLSHVVAPTPFLMTCSTLLMIAAGWFALDGLRQFLGQKPLGLGPLLAVLSAVLVILAVFIPASESPAGREAIGAGYGALIYTLAGVTVLCNWTKEREIAPYLLLCCCASFAIAALHVFEIFPAFGHLGIVEKAIEPDLWAATLFAARLAAVPLFFLCIILMLHGWMIISLRHMIAHDDLTGALSRRAFMHEFEQIFAGTAATGKQTAFLLLDLDRFKEINDVHGHAGGDVALAHFAATVRSALAGRGVFGRLGGEEFGIVIPATSRLEASTIASQVCMAVRTIPARSGTDAEIAMTVSIGLALADLTNTPAETMVQADVALYEAKATGRDRISVADSFQTPMTGSARALAGAAAQMRAAVVGSTVSPANSASGTG